MLTSAKCTCDDTPGQPNVASMLRITLGLVISPRIREIIRRNYLLRYNSAIRVKGIRDGRVQDDHYWTPF
jgi:hypothetical protein